MAYEQFSRSWNNSRSFTLSMPLSNFIALIRTSYFPFFSLDGKFPFPISNLIKNTVHQVWLNKKQRKIYLTNYTVHKLFCHRIPTKIEAISWLIMSSSDSFTNPESTNFEELLWLYLCTINVKTNLHFCRFRIRETYWFNWVAESI